MSVVNLSKTGVAYDNHGYHPAASTYDRRHERAQALCVNAFSVDPLFPLTFRLRFVDPRWSPFAMRHCRVEDWRAGLGRSSCSLLARPFVCECHSISTMLTFPIPATSTAAHG